MDSYTDLPFMAPPDIVLDVPLPPSVNETRRINYPGARKLNKWKEAADMLVMANGQYRAARPHAVRGRYELTIVLDEARCKVDPDNLAKAACDYLKRLNLITDDSPKCARRIVIEFGPAPEGCRLILKPLEEA